jgi:hypothetical protein
MPCNAMHTWRNKLETAVCECNHIQGCPNNVAVILCSLLLCMKVNTHGTKLCSEMRTAVVLLLCDL